MYVYVHMFVYIFICMCIHIYLSNFYNCDNLHSYPLLLLYDLNWILKWSVLIYACLLLKHEGETNIDIHNIMFDGYHG